MPQRPRSGDERAVRRLTREPRVPSSRVQSRRDKRGDQGRAKLGRKKRNEDDDDDEDDEV